MEENKDSENAAITCLFKANIKQIQKEKEKIYIYKQHYD